MTCLIPEIPYRLHRQSELNMMFSRLPMVLLLTTPLRLSIRTSLRLCWTTPRTSPTSADPLVLPGLTSFTTQFPGRLKAMLLSMKLELQRPAMLAIVRVTALGLDTAATVTASPRETSLLCGSVHYSDVMAPVGRWLTLVSIVRGICS